MAIPTSIYVGKTCIGAGELEWLRIDCRKSSKTFAVSCVNKTRPARATATLLDRYVRYRDEAAFEVLVRRYGPMILHVCRRILRNQADAEDAFQATFVVLVRKAASLGQRWLVGNWLHGVAYRIAQDAKRANAMRRLKEREAMQIPKPDSMHQELWASLEPILDEELSQLPAKYRIVFLLCDMDGKTRQAGLAAARLPGRDYRQPAIPRGLYSRSG